MKRKYVILSALVFSLIIVCVGCLPSGKGVPEELIKTELGVIADRADKVTYSHDFDNSTKIDTVTVAVTYDNEYCKSVGTCTYKYQYYKSDGVWDLLSDGSWAWDEHLKDFSDQESEIETFADLDGYYPAENEDHFYFYLNIKPGSIDIESNTLECRYVVEDYRYNKTYGYYETVNAYSSDGYERVTATIMPGGAVYVKLKDPSTDRSAALWLNPEAYIDVNLFV